MTKLSRRGLLLGGTALLLADRLAFGMGGLWSSIDGSGGYTDAVLGSLTPPNGTPQYPHLLDSYVTSGPPRRQVLPLGTGRQPPWAVAGVDYYVGIDSSVTLANPSTLFPSGSDFTVNNSNNTWVIGGTTSHTVSGIDFTLNGPNGNPYTVVINSLAPALIKFVNCKFGFFTQMAIASSWATSALVQQQAGSTANLAFINCIADGGNVNSALTSWLYMNGRGNSVTLLYNWVKGFSYGPFVFNMQPDTNYLGLYCRVIYQYNLVERNSRWINGHLNIQEFPSCLQFLVPTTMFNTVYQEPNAAGGEFFQWYQGVQVNNTTFTGSISGTQLTAGPVSNSVLYPGAIISGTGVAPGTRITDIVGSPGGGAGTYIVNPGQTVGSTSMSSTAPCISVHSPVCNYNTMISTSVCAPVGTNGGILAPWQASHSYHLGDVVTITGGIATQYICTPQPRRINSLYALNEMMSLSQNDVNLIGSGKSDWYMCTTAGTTFNGTAPAAYHTSGSPGATVTDGTAVFTGHNAYDAVVSGGSSPNMTGVGNGQFGAPDGSVMWYGNNLSVSSMLHGLDQPAGFWTLMDGVGQCQWNFIDRSGVQSGMFYPSTFWNWQIANNINMNTGAVNPYPG